MFRLYSISHNCISPTLVFHDGIWRAEAIGAVGWGRTERQAVQALLGQPPFELGVQEITEEDEIPKFQLLAEIARKVELENDWRLHTPSAWEVDAHGKTNPQKLSLWDYRITRDTPIARLVAVPTTVNIRWRVVGAETYQISMGRSGYFRPADINGNPAPWP